MYLLNVIEERELLELVDKWCSDRSIVGLDVNICKDVGEKIYLSENKVDELQDTIDELEDKVDELETENEDLKSQLEDLKSQLEELNPSVIE